jgi:hypothetical protein
VTLVGMEGSLRKAQAEFRELPSNFEVCEIARSRFWEAPFDPEMEFSVENIAPQLYVAFICRTRDFPSLIIICCSRKNLFVAEAKDVFNYLYLHIFDRNASSPTLASSCNGGKKPDSIVVDSLSFSGPLVAEGLPNTPLILNNPSGLLEIGADPLWFPVTSAGSDPLNIPTLELLQNAWSMV